MENLPAELLLSIFELGAQSVQDLVALRSVCRRFHDLADQSCARLALQLGRAHFHAFDDALVAIRVASIPLALCCRYDSQQKEYSFVPSNNFLHAVANGRAVPPGCPNINYRPWIQECAAVMDLYLVALAWLESPTHPALHRPYELPQLAALRPRFLDAYLRSFYRVIVFFSLFGPGVFSEPVLDAVAQFGMTKPEDDYHHGEIEHEVLEAVRNVPIWRNTTGTHAIFDGFFQWLYSQPQPTSTVFAAPKAMNWTCSESQRNVLALVQFWKVARHLTAIHRREPPWREHHVKAHLISYAYLLPDTVYRKRLAVSPWSAPEIILDHWSPEKSSKELTKKPSINLPSLVLERRYHICASTGAFFAGGGYSELDPFTCVLRRELATRFGKKCSENSLTWLLNPFHQLSNISPSDALFGQLENS